MCWEHFLDVDFAFADVVCWNTLFLSRVFMRALFVARIRVVWDDSLLRDAASAISRQPNTTSTSEAGVERSIADTSHQFQNSPSAMKSTKVTCEAFAQM